MGLVKLLYLPPPTVAAFAIVFFASFLDCPVTANSISCDTSSLYRTLDGTCNNPGNPMLGAVGATLLLPETSVEANSSDNLPSARTVSNVLLGAWWSPRSEHLTDLSTYWAQFVDHDLIRFAKPGAQAAQLPIKLASHDPEFRGPSIPFGRLDTVQTSKGRSPRNELSSFLDASLLYGTTTKNLADLRDFDDGCRLLTGPYDSLPQKNGEGTVLAGDKRANENILLASIHTLFLREHNKLCGELAVGFPAWDAERRFKTARKVTGALLQAVTYDEWLPTIIGPDALPSYTTYNANVDPRPSLVFAGAVFRIGHVMVNDEVVARYDNGSQNLINVERTLFAPALLQYHGIDSILRGMVTNQAKAMTMNVVHGLRNMLITETGGRLLDLAAINIQRGRDLNVPKYNHARRLYGLPPARDFHEITRDRHVAEQMRHLYKHVDLVDAWIGGLAEEAQGSSLMGPLFTAVWIDDFRRARDGDRFFFLRPGLFDDELISKLPVLRKVLDRNRRAVMKAILLRNSGLTTHDVRDNPFIPAGATYKSFES